MTRLELVNMAHIIIEMDNEIHDLRAENKYLNEMNDKRKRMLDASLQQSNAMMCTILDKVISND